MKRSGILQKLLTLLYPPRCMFCGVRVAAEKQVCPYCEKSFFGSSVLFRLPMGTRTVYGTAPCFYRDGVRRAMLRFKFHGRQEYAPYFAKKMEEAIRENGFAGRISYITDVPLSRKRLLARGYNQSALLAKAVAEELGLPYEKTLHKYRENRPQHNLRAEERRKNVRGVYRIEEGAAVSGKYYLLVDDIITTGETLAECVRVLSAGGAAGVLCAAAAKAGEKHSRNSE